MMTPQILWHTKLKDEHITAALEYLDLIFSSHDLEKAKLLIEKHKHDITMHKAKDILRASNTPPLAATDGEVMDHLKKIHAGKPLHPVILVSKVQHERLEIADGYHRISACYSIDDAAEVAAVHVDL